MHEFRSRLAIAAVPLLLLAASPAAALDYPTKPVELIVPFSPGGTTDNMARLLARRFGEAWPQQPIVVNNRPGGGSTIGTAAAAKAAPDGHTVLVSTIAFAISAAHSSDTSGFNLRGSGGGDCRWAYMIWWIVFCPYGKSPVNRR